MWVVPLLGEDGDRHRAFALAVDLDQLVAQAPHRFFQVRGVHGPATVDDGLEVARVGLLDGGAVDEARHHGRGGEKANALVGGQEEADLLRVEAPAFGDHLVRRLRHVGHDVQARAVGHGSRVEDAVPLGDRVDVGEVAQRHRKEVPMGQHGPLGPAGRSARIEKPGDILRLSLLHGDGIAFEQGAVVRRPGRDHALEAGNRVPERAHGLHEVRRREADPRPRIF